MKNRPIGTGGPAYVPSLADLLAAGFGAFLRRPLVLIVPLLLDVWLWFGPRITPQPFVGWAGRWLGHNASMLGLTDQPALQDAVNSTALVDMRRSVVTQLFASLLRGTSSSAGSNLVWNPADGWTLLGVILALQIGGLVASSAMLVPLGEQVAGRPGWGLRRIIASAGQLAQLLLLIAGMGVLFAVPMLIGMAILLNVSPQASQIAAFIIVLALLVSWFLASFSIEAMLVGQVRPLVALYQSYNLVRANLVTAMLLVVGSFILSQGFAALLRPLLASGWGLIGASGLYAALSSVLAATRMIFYRERVTRLARTTPVALTHK